MPREPRVPSTPLYALTQSSLAVELSEPLVLWIGRGTFAGPLFSPGIQWQPIEVGGGGYTGDIPPPPATGGPYAWDSDTGQWVEVEHDAGWY